MMARMNIQDSPRRSRVHPQKFALYLAFGSIIMMFTAFTSAFIVKQAQGDWLEFAMPSIFFYSTAVLLLSSVTLHWSYNAFKKENKIYKYLLGISFILGIAFIVLQYKGWYFLFDQGVDMKRNVAGSFFYLITGVHALHILGGITAIFVTLLSAFATNFKATEKRILRYSLVLNYWHFVDVLWIYLFGFLLFYR